MRVNLDDATTWAHPARQDPPATFSQMPVADLIDALVFLHAHYVELYREAVGLTDDAVHVSSDVMLWWWVARPAVRAVLLELDRRGESFPPSLVGDLVTALNYGALDSEHATIESQDPTASQTCIIGELSEAERNARVKSFRQEHGQPPRRLQL